MRGNAKLIRRTLTIAGALLALSAGGLGFAAAAGAVPSDDPPRCDALFNSPRLFRIMDPLHYAALHRARGNSVPSDLRRRERRWTRRGYFIRYADPNLMSFPVLYRKVRRRVRGRVRIVTVRVSARYRPNRCSEGASG